jgi:magnesium-dependent phosphatase 1
MYILWGGGAPFSVADDSNSVLHDRNGARVELLGISAQVLHDLKHDPAWSNTVIAIASTTDEPQWAKECLKKFHTQPSRKPILTSFDSIQIFHDNKRTHFKNMQKEYPHIQYDEMIFFDNQMNNINDVSKLGVHCVYSPDGITSEIWEYGLQSYHDKHSPSK